MFLFTGFNGFGQFGNIEKKQTTYIEVRKSDILVDNDISAAPAADGSTDIDKDNESDVSDKSAANDSNENLLIAPSWRYAAFACGSQLWLRGLLYRECNEVLKVQAPDVIRTIAVCDKYCLVLLANGQLYKIESKLKASLELIKLEENPIKKLKLPQKRTIFGLPETLLSTDEKEVQQIKITHVACGSHISAAVSDTNVIYSIPSVLYQLERHRRVVQLVCGYEHAMILDANGDLFTWGNGLRGQLGHPNLDIEELPVQLESLAGIKIVYIAAGGWHSAAVTVYGDLYTWGLNTNGQLGLCMRDVNCTTKLPTVFPLPAALQDEIKCCQKFGVADIDNAPEPPITSIMDAATSATEVLARAAAYVERGRTTYECNPVRVYAGARHTVVQMSCGSLWAVGWSKHGQLGVLVREPSINDFLLVNVPKDSVKDVICGPWSTVIVK